MTPDCCAVCSRRFIEEAHPANGRKDTRGRLGRTNITTTTNAGWGGRGCQERWTNRCGRTGGAGSLA